MQRQLQEVVELNALSATNVPLTVCCTCVVTCVCAMNVPSNNGGARAVATAHSAGLLYGMWYEPTNPDSGPWPHAPSSLCLYSWRQGKCSPITRDFHPGCRTWSYWKYVTSSSLHWAIHQLCSRKKAHWIWAGYYLAKKQLKCRDLMEHSTSKM